MNHHTPPWAFPSARMAASTPVGQAAMPGPSSSVTPAVGGAGVAGGGALAPGSTPLSATAAVSAKLRGTGTGTSSTLDVLDVFSNTDRARRTGSATGSNLAANPNAHTTNTAAAMVGDGGTDAAPHGSTQPPSGDPGPSNAGPGNTGATTTGPGGAANGGAAAPPTPGASAPGVAGLGDGGGGGGGGAASGELPMGQDATAAHPMAGFGDGDSVGVMGSVGDGGGVQSLGGSSGRQFTVVEHALAAGEEAGNHPMFVIESARRRFAPGTMYPLKLGRFTVLRVVPTVRAGNVVRVGQRGRKAGVVALLRGLLVPKRNERVVAACAWTCFCVCVCVCVCFVRIAADDAYQAPAGTVPCLENCAIDSSAWCTSRMQQHLYCGTCWCR